MTFQRPLEVGRHLQWKTLKVSKGALDHVGIGVKNHGLAKFVKSDTLRNRGRKGEYDGIAKLYFEIIQRLVFRGRVSLLFFETGLIKGNDAYSNGASTKYV